MIVYFYLNVTYERRNIMYNKKKHIKTQDVVVMYTAQHLSSCEIQRLIGMSRTGIMKRLRKAGVTTNQGEWVNVACDFCGGQYRLVRSRWRKAEKHYCKTECYYAALENPGYHPWRQGQRLARAIISQYFTLQENNVIHHKDGDNRNNDRSNLAVYQSQSDHMNHHRNGNAQPIWDGVTQT